MKKKLLCRTGFITATPLVLILLQGCSEAKKPNIVFILADDLGYTDLGCYGSTFYETPNIDRLAMQGVRFSDSYAACPVSSPTRASIMTGKYPVKTGITDWILGRQETHELYDLENDISETKDISLSEPGKTDELFKLLDDWRKINNAKMMIPNANYKYIRTLNPN